MSILTAPRERQPSVARDPFCLGWRYVKEKAEDGTEVVKQVPLNAWDVLHPQEGDFIVQNYAHTRDCIYIQQSIEAVLSPRKQSLVLCDHRVDWQVPGLEPHGPDVSAFDDLKDTWDITRGTFKVHEMGATILLAVEVTSPSTWLNDTEIKVDEYYLARVPYYVIVNRVQLHDDQPTTVIGYRTTPEGFVRMRHDSVRGIWIPTVGIGFKIVDGRVRCVNQAGDVIPDRAELEEHVQTMVARLAETERLRQEADERAETEKQRAETEKQRAEAANQRAESEKLRADEATSRIRQLEAELKQKR